MIRFYDKGVTDDLIDLRFDIRVFLQVTLRCLTPLADPAAFVLVPCPALLDDFHIDRDIKERAFLGDPFPLHDIELSHLERRSDFGLHVLRFRAVADDI